MAAPTGSKFYIPTPVDEYWGTGFPKCVVEAIPVDPTASGLYEWQRTDQYVRENLKVINPPRGFVWPHIEKDRWVECSGPSRKLEPVEYIELYHSLNPNFPLPKGWKEYKTR